MIFIETSIFTKKVKDLLSEDQYRSLQDALMMDPNSGARIQGSGGLRKLRWKIEEQGKSGGVRIIYYWMIAQDRIFMLYIYPKSKQDDLTHEQLKCLKKVVEEELS